MKYAVLRPPKVVEEVQEEVQEVGEMSEMKGMEDSRSKRYAHFMYGHEMRAQDRLEPCDAVCES